MADSTISQLEQLASFMALLDTGKMDSILESVATRIAGSGARDISDAIEQIKASGEDPDKYLPVSRTYTRQRQQRARDELSRLKAEQELRHAEELHQVKLARLNAGTQGLQAAADLVSAATPDES
jgi:hypothetical protein